jgi:DNA-nicking Smr family endonuclease
MDHLRDLIKGSVEMDISFSDEYIEGCVKGLSRKIMRKLKKGELPVQDYIDLHGFTRQEAEERVKEFLIRSYRLGLRCVLIVHGRGLNSPHSLPVIKEGLLRWLGQGAIRKIVLAFSTARPYDGGTGAIYVLMKRR